MYPIANDMMKIKASTDLVENIWGKLQKYPFFASIPKEYILKKGVLDHAGNWLVLRKLAARAEQGTGSSVSQALELSTRRYRISWKLKQIRQK